MLMCKFLPIFESLKSHNSVTSQWNATKLCTLNELVTFSVKQIKIAESIGVLHPFV